RTFVRSAVLVFASAAVLTLLLAQEPHAPARAVTPPPQPYLQGTSNACVDFELDILSGFITNVLELGVLDDLGIYDIDEEAFQVELPDEGWVWVDPRDPYQEVEGEVVDA